MTEGPDDEGLWRQYGHALDEYRFQVQLNWDRVKYLLTLDVGVVPAATALLGIEGMDNRLVAGVFMSGVLVSTLGVVTLLTQRGYYASTRELKGRLEDALGLGDFAIRTTPGMAKPDGQKRRLMKVTEVQRGIFIALGLVHVVGAILSLIE